MGQRKSCDSECLKNSFPSPIHSTKSFRQLSPYFNDTHLSLSSKLNILGLPLTKTLYWKSHTSSLAESAFKKLGVLYRLHQFFSPYQLLTLYRDFIRPYMEQASHVWDSSLRTKSKAFRIIDSPPLTDCIQPPTLRCLLFSIFIFMLTALLNLLTACLHPSGSLAANNFLLTLISILSTSFMPLIPFMPLYFHSFFHSSGKLFRTLYLNLYFHLTTI